MTAFGWKRKMGQNLFASSSFIDDEDDDGSSTTCFDSHNISRFKEKKRKMDSSCSDRSCLLKEKGVNFAENGRYADAITVWNQALLLTPSDAQLLEMKAQVLLEMNKAFPSFQSARLAVMADPRWWVAYQTLGRAQLSLGEIKMATVSFSKALHINPSCEELWIEDLKWALKLLEKEKLQIESSENSPETMKAVCDQNKSVAHEEFSSFCDDKQTLFENIPTADDA